MFKHLFILTCFSTLAACHPAKDCIGKPNQNCICTMEYDPVCGCNNKTYSNACVAECDGIKKYTKGACSTASTPALEGNTWKLAKLSASNGTIQVPADVDAFMKLEAGQMTGRGGCNNIGGAYTLKGAKLKFSSLMSTKMYCDKTMMLETKFLEWLEKSQSFSIQDDQLEINCGSAGNLVFKKA